MRFFKKRTIFIFTFAGSLCFAIYYLSIRELRLSETILNNIRISLDGARGIFIYKFSSLHPFIQTIDTLTPTGYEARVALPLVERSAFIQLLSTASKESLFRISAPRFKPNYLIQVINNEKHNVKIWISVDYRMIAINNVSIEYLPREVANAFQEWCNIQFRAQKETACSGHAPAKAPF